MPSIPYARHSLDQTDREAVFRVLASDRLTQGPEVDAFEQEFAKKVGAPYAVAFSSGTAALHAACYAGGLKPKAILLTSALTFVASANCGHYLGARIGFTDIDPETWNMSAETLAATRTDPHCVVPIHFAGFPASMPEIVHAVSDWQPTIIEDCCHALGSPGVGSCEHSDFCCFSFHPTKAITTAEGGMVTCRTKANAKALKKFRNHGFTLSKGHYREMTSLGYNYRLSDIHAALGRSQLQRLDSFIEARKEIAGRYFEELKGVELPPYHDDHAWHLFVIRHENRDALYGALKERGIGTQVHYVPLHFNSFYGQNLKLPHVEAYYREALSLPIHPSLTNEEQSYVIENVNALV